jgi:hypothetical protein
VRERSRLLIEAQFQVLNLEDYPEQNRDDVQAYIQQCFTPLTLLTKAPVIKEGTGMEESLVQGGTKMEKSLATATGGTGEGEESATHISPPLITGALVRRAGGVQKELEERSNLNSWLTTHHLTETEFIQQLTAQSENNFMYLSQILPTITQEFDSEPFQIDHLPPGLETYYQSHWQRMGDKDLSAVELGVLHCLATPQPPLNNEGISAELIAQTIDEDEYEVETILENCIEFLQQQQIESETRYRLYHSHFRDWLNQRISNLTP